MKNYAFWVIFAFVFSGLGVRAAAQDLLGVRFGPNRDETRIVFDLIGAPKYAISGVETGNGRLVVDFAHLSIRPGDQEYRAGKGHVDRFGFASRADGGVRASFDLKKTAKIKTAFLIEPKGDIKKHRLVIDLETADKQAFLASLPSQYPDLGAFIERATAGTQMPDVVAPASPSQKEVARPSTEKRVIIVDAGHGGADPGAQGQSGTLEKTVTLAAAKTLRDILEKTGRYKVVLTREDDSKIPLDKREEMARKAGADLFISLHADALASKAIRGGSVYTLSKQGSERSAKLAKKDGNYTVYNLDVASYGEEVGDMLFDLAQGATNTSSSLFAEKLLANLTGKTPLLNRSHRTGDLRVLLAPDVPAVLFEMAYISNAKDEANLKSPVWRKRAMGAVADSIDQYFRDYGERRFASNSAGGSR